MANKKLTAFSLEKAKSEYMELLVANGMTPGAETVPVADAAGRTTAAPVYARICAPHYNASAMDGVALDAKLTVGATGATPVILSNEQYRLVNTGDPLPQGCDAVVMIEDVVRADGGTNGAGGAKNAGGVKNGAGGVTNGAGEGPIKLVKPAAPWQHIRQIGEDICAGEMVLPSLSLLTPAALGVIYASGVTDISVIKRPIAGIIPTGDELVPPTADPGDGDILEFNSTIFSAMLKQWGAETITFPIVKDDRAKICDALRSALSVCDIVILNAGSSAGSEDFSAAAIREVGQVLYHGLAIKPGKPTILGYDGAKPILGVPGYPVSGIMVLEQIMRPIIEYLSRKSPERYKYVDAVLSKSVVSALDYQEFIRVRVGYVKDRLIATPLNRGSGIVTSIMKADGIVEAPQGVGRFENGDVVSVRLLRPEEELKNSLVVIGSHDPLLDELSELMRVRFGDVSIGSAHTGSVGGLNAVRRGEAHLAGVHLLDEDSGQYNISFVHRFFPKGGVRLVECVKRSQGFILGKGNPFGIKGVADLTKEGLRYVNRQKGSGTRILIDYLCAKDGVDPSGIYGYNREEYTHTSVAALVAGGSADAGLGILSAARLYGLDFVPVCLEQYDLLIPDHAWDDPMVQMLLDVLRSDAFRRRLDDMGGYVTENPGAVRKVF